MGAGKQTQECSRQVNSRVPSRPKPAACSIRQEPDLHFLEFSFVGRFKTMECSVENIRNSLFQKQIPYRSHYSFAVMGFKLKKTISIDADMVLICYAR